MEGLLDLVVNAWRKVRMGRSSAITIFNCLHESEYGHH